MIVDLTDKVVIVTGAARGIGAEIARRFVAEGAHVFGVDSGWPEPIVDAGSGTGEPSPALRRIRADVTSVDEISEAFAEVLREHGRIDVLINNAGVAANGAIEDLSDDVWARCFDVNVRGVFNCCRAVIPAMKDAQGGRIINAASFAAIVPQVFSAGYAASKAAVAQFTRGLAGELGPWGITVNAYAPGMIPTDINGYSELSEVEKSLLLDTLTLRRWGKASEVADLLCFVASDRAAYITGTLIDVSGGKLATQVPSLAYNA